MTEEERPIPFMMKNPATGRMVRTDNNKNRRLLGLPPMKKKRKVPKPAPAPEPEPESESESSESDQEDVERLALLTKEPPAAEEDEPPAKEAPPDPTPTVYEKLKDTGIEGRFMQGRVFHPMYCRVYRKNMAKRRRKSKPDAEQVA